MKISLTRLGIAAILVSILSGPSLADEQADWEIRQRKAEAYAREVYAKYPAKQAYILHDKTPAGQGAADEIYQIIRNNGDDALVYKGFNLGDNLSEQDYAKIEKADVFFCGCSRDIDAANMKAAIEAQGFKGTFVHPRLPR